MPGLKEVLDKFPNELKDAIIEFHDFLKEEYIIKREEFESLKKTVNQLVIAIEKLTIAQQASEERLTRLEEAVEKLTIAQQASEERLTRLEEAVEKLTIAQQASEERLTRLEEAIQASEERLTRLEEAIEQLSIAQQKTEQRLNELAIAQQKTEERLNALAIAQEKTEKEIKSLTISFKRMQKEFGGLSHSIGFELENQAYKALPKILKERFGIEMKERLLRKYIEYPDGSEEEINIYGEARKNGKTIFIIGEAKTHLSMNDIKKFKKRIERLQRIIKEEIFPIFVVHTASPKIVKHSLDSGFLVFFSYEF